MDVQIKERAEEFVKLRSRFPAVLDIEVQSLRLVLDLLSSLQAAEEENAMIQEQLRIAHQPTLVQQAAKAAGRREAAEGCLEIIDDHDSKGPYYIATDLCAELTAAITSKYLTDKGGSE